MITPGKYQELRSSRDSAIEDRIDQAIREHAKDGDVGPIKLDATIFNAPIDDIERVLKKYTAAGWDAEYVYDGRDGDFVRLEQP